MKFKNASGAPLSFPYGDEDVASPRIVQTEHGRMQTMGMSRVEKMYRLEAGEVVELPDAIAFKPYGVGSDRPSYLESAGLVGKLVPVLAAPKQEKAKA